MTRELRAVMQARERRDLSTETFHRRIREAYAKHTVREIAEAAGLSASRVFQIVRSKKGKAA